MTTQIKTGVIADASITTAKFDPAAVCPSATNATNATNVTGTGVVTSSNIADGTIQPADMAQPFTRGTAVASTSGTAIDFTSIPSWVKRITVVCQGVSLSATAYLLLQIGTSSAIENTGYTSTSSNFVGNISSTAGFASAAGGSAAYLMDVVYTLFNVTGNIWVATHTGQEGATYLLLGTGSKTLAGVLNKVRLTSNSTDTFDAGTINILYE